MNRMLMLAALLLGACILTAAEPEAWKPWVLEHTWGTTRSHHLHGTRSLAVSPDGTQVLSTAMDATARLWRVADGIEEVRIASEGWNVESGAFLGQDRVVLGAGWDKDCGEPVVCNRSNGREVARFTGHRGSVQAVAGDAAGTMVASFGSLDIHIAIWDPATGALIRTCTPRLPGVQSLWFSVDGSQLIAYNAGEREGEVKAEPGIYIYEVATGRLLRSVAVPQMQYGMANLSPDQTWAVVGRDITGEDPQSRLVVCDLSAGTITATAACPGRLSGLCIRQDGSIVVATDGGLLTTTRSLGQLNPTAMRKPAGLVAASPDGRWVVDGAVRFWDATTWAEVHADPDRHSDVRGLASRDGLVLSAHDGEGLLCWSPDSATPLWSKPLMDARCVALTGSKPDDHLALVHGAATAALVLGSGRTVPIETGYTFALSPSGRWAAMPEVSLVHLVDVQGGGQMLTDVAVPADGHVAGGVGVTDDGTLHVLLRPFIGPLTWWSRSIGGGTRSHALTNPDAEYWTMTYNCQIAIDGRGHHMLVPISESKYDGEGWAFFTWPEAGDAIAATQTELFDTDETVLGVSLNTAGTTALVMTSPNWGVRRARIYTIAQGRMTHRQTITLPAGWWEWHLRSDQPGLLVGAGDGVVRAYGPGEPAAEPEAPHAIAMITPVSRGR